MNSPIQPGSTLGDERHHRSLWLVAGLGAVIALGACSAGAATGDASAGPAAREPGTAGGPPAWSGGASEWNGGVSVGHADLASRIEGLPVTTLTAGEIDGLLWMREEEKLAHDVYVTLGESWGDRVFENIARAETIHMEAVKALLDRHGIDDPVGDNAVGVFTDPAIQALYDDLVAEGRTSRVAAMTVGARIEELDISDLRERTTTTQDIALVYAELERGSENHLRAFVRNLDRLGETYAPIYLSVDEFDAIVGAGTDSRATGDRAGLGGGRGAGAGAGNGAGWRAGYGMGAVAATTAPTARRTSALGRRAGWAGHERVDDRGGIEAAHRASEADPVPPVRGGRHDDRLVGHRRLERDRRLAGPGRRRSRRAALAPGREQARVGRRPRRCLVPRVGPDPHPSHRDAARRHRLRPAPPDRTSERQPRTELGGHGPSSTCGPSSSSPWSVSCPSSS